MLGKLLKHAAAQAGLTTYGIGLLQTKAYRILNQQTAQALKKDKIVPVDWALLGLLYDSKTNLRMSELAFQLGVEAPFITERGQVLEKLGLIKISALPNEDRRVKYITLTALAREKIPEIETTLIKVMRPLLQGASIKDALGYKKILENIVNNKPNK